MSAVGLTYIAGAVDPGNPTSLALPSTVDLVQGRSYFCLVESTTQTSSIDSCTSTGETWTQIATMVVGGNTQTKVYYCRASANRTDTTITAALTGSNGASIMLVEAANIPAPHAAGKMPVRGFISNFLGANTAIQMTIPGIIGSSSSRTLGLAIYKANESAAAGGDSSTLGQTNHGAPTTGMVSVSDDDLVLDAAWTSSVANGMYAFELEAEDEIESTWLADLGFSGTDSSVLTTTAAAPAESTICGVVHWYGTQTLNSIADDGEGLTWEIDNVYNPANDHKMAFIRAKAPAGLTLGSDVTLTFSGTPSFGPGFSLAAFSNQLDVDEIGTGVSNFEEVGSISVDTTAAKTMCIAHIRANVTTDGHDEVVGSWEATPEFISQGDENNVFLWKRGYGGAVVPLFYDLVETGAFSVASIAISYEISAYSGGTPQELAAVGDTETGGTGRISVPKMVAAAGDVEAGGSGTLLVARLLAAAGDTLTGGLASLLTGKPLAASGDTQTGGQARLQVGAPTGIQRFRMFLGIGR